MVNVNDLIITSLDTIAAFGLGSDDGKYLFRLDELQNASIGQGQEKTDLTGKAGRKLATLKRNKTITVSGTNGMLSGGLLELQTGGKFVKDTDANAEIIYRQTDYFTKATGTTTYNLTGKPNSGALVSVYTRNVDGTLGTELTLTTEATPTAGQYKYAYTAANGNNPATSVLTVGNLTTGTEIVAIYDRKVEGAKLDNQSDKFSGKAKLYIDATAEDKCSNVYHVQICIPKADINGEFTIDMGDNQAVHNFEAEGLAGACGAGETLWTFIVIEDGADDVA